MVFGLNEMTNENSIFHMQYSDHRDRYLFGDRMKL